jgi:predicted nucleic acid-binding protein
MRYLLDTNVVSEASKKRPLARVLNFLQANEPLCAVPAIVLGERYHGAYVAPPEQRETMLKTVRDFGNEFADRILPFDAEAAAAWGEYVSRPALKRKPRSYPDTQIAAIALARNLILVTRNTEDFPEIDTLNPFED